jgi:dTDP-4-amino-4,6-dideoxygalactose transaminase
LDGLQAAILRVKLRHLSQGNQSRRQIAQWYEEWLQGVPQVQRVVTRKDAEPVFHLYVIQVDERDRILQHLQQSGIGAGVHYPIPLHEQSAYAYLGLAPEYLPTTHRAAQRVLSLPIYPEMTKSQVESVVNALKDAIENVSSD